MCTYTVTMHDSYLKRCFANVHVLPFWSTPDDILKPPHEIVETKTNICARKYYDVLHMESAGRSCDMMDGLCMMRTIIPLTEWAKMMTTNGMQKCSMDNTEQILDPKTWCFYFCLVGRSCDMMDGLWMMRTIITLTEWVKLMTTNGMQKCSMDITEQILDQNNCENSYEI